MEVFRGSLDRGDCESFTWTGGGSIDANTDPEEAGYEGWSEGRRERDGKQKREKLGVGVGRGGGCVGGWRGYSLLLIELTPTLSLYPVTYWQ